MNFIALSYFVEVAKELNMNRAAHKLHVTQQTLSFQIQKLEAYYGTPLFYRKPRFTLTYAGEILLKNAEDILNRCDSVMDQMAAISGTCAGKLRVGISTYPAQVALPLIVPPFLKKWPNVRLLFPRRSMVDRVKSILDSSLDLCIGIYDGNDSQINAEFLFDDQLYMVASDALLQKFYGQEHAEQLKREAQNGTNLHAFSTLPFMVLSSSSHLGNTINNYFIQMGITPQVVAEAGTLDILVSLSSLDIGAFICGRLRLSEIMQRYPNLNAFPLVPQPTKSLHHFMLLTLQGRDFPSYTYDFIKLTKEAFSALDQNILISSKMGI